MVSREVAFGYPRRRQTTIKALHVSQTTVQHTDIAQMPFQWHFNLMFILDGSCARKSDHRRRTAEHPAKPAIEGAEKRWIVKCL